MCVRDFSGMLAIIDRFGKREPVPLHTKKQTDSEENSRTLFD